MLHHILDPRTGRPADAVWRTVSVAADSCADANAASTAAVIRGRAALGWLAKLGLPARLVDATGVVFTVAGWPAATRSSATQRPPTQLHRLRSQLRSSPQDPQTAARETSMT